MCGWKWEKWNKGKEAGRNIINSKDAGVDNFWWWCSYCRTLLFFSFFSHYVMKWGKKKISLFLHYFVPPFSFARDMVTGKRVKISGTMEFATCMAQERWHCFSLIRSRFRVAENGNLSMLPVSGRILIPWYLEARDEIPRSYARWLYIASNVVIYTCPLSNPIFLVVSLFKVYDLHVMNDFHKPGSIYGANGLEFIRK